MHFYSTWGLFSPRSVDEGTRLLVDQLDINEGETCLDIGCGYGAVGIVMARLSGTGSVYMVDKDFVAVKVLGSECKTEPCDKLRSDHEQCI